ncbi:PP2C family protein-serine/threonine phosphatase [Modestobacter sp. Leaf380]|uniref:PP2C family protein-serine/threonine phosphatase n=1 Tax=Modestobacter sp. Leaf380 TaxID=1736356 RepID=UPI0006F2570A|nr:SpoIIE family protein phosphatase [Modestobacter sp. Leaf380]KQS69272.1 hypothetical protein ASG41_21915 [Modestobacter sp. Leaf380]
MRRHGLTRWVLVLSALLLVLIVAASTAVFATEDQVQATQARQDELSRADRIEARLLTGYVDEETGLRGYLLTGAPDFLTPYREAADAVPALTDDLRVSWAEVGGPAELVDRLDEAHAAWVAYAQSQIDAVAAGRGEDASSVVGTKRGKQLFDTIRVREQAVADWLTTARDATADRLGELQDRLTMLLSATLTTLLLVTVVGCVVLWRALARPLSRLAEATRAVAAGDLGATLPVTGAQEMRSLAADVTAMRDRLAADLHSSRRALGALEQTGPAVSALREALEPAEDDVPGMTVAGRLDPAEGVLAGDWFDTVALSPTRLALVVGDVAGHGPASAVFALRLKHTLLAALRAGLSPGDALTAVCTDLAEVPVGRFATVFVAVLDAAEHTLAHANAGHPSGLLLRSTDGAPTHLELGTTGPLLSSAMLGRRWRTETVGTDPGDVLLVFTDGVTESRGPAGEEFGTEGVLATAADHPGAEPGRLVAALAAASMRFGGSAPRRDDHTVVCVRVDEPDR